MEKAYSRSGEETRIREPARDRDWILRFVVSAVVMCIPLTPGGSLATSVREYRYYGTVSGDSVLLREPIDGGEPGELVYAGHAFYPARFCEAQSTAICIFSDRLTFAVPKHKDPLAKGWTVDGAKFEIVKENVSVEIVGRKFDNLMVITTPAETDAGGRASGKANFFLYSYATGLVAFGRSQSPTQSITFWMQGPVGFGALVGDLH